MKGHVQQLLWYGVGDATWFGNKLGPHNMDNAIDLCKDIPRTDLTGLSSGVV